MPSLVNFQPLIDASKEKARADQRASENRARAIERGFGQATQALEIMGERGRQREKQFQSIFDYDLNKNAAKEARNMLANKYGQIKQDGVRMFEENKNFLGYGKLSPEQRIQLDDELDSFKREAELHNVISSQIGNGEKLAASRPSAIKVNREKIGEYLQLLKPDAEGQYDTDGLAKFIAEVDQSPTGQPFTDYKDFDMDFYVQKGGKDAIKAELKPTISTENITVNRNGKKYTEKYETKQYGSLEERQNTLFGMLSSSKDQDLYEYNIGKMLNDNERDQAIADFVGKVANPMTAYYAYNKADLTSGYEERRLKGKVTAPITKKGRSGSGDGPEFIEKDNGTWKLGTTPIRIKTDIDGEPLSGVIQEIREDENGDTFAKIVYKPEYGDTQFIEKPLEGLYDEIDRALKRYPKGGLELEGWEDIKFKEKEPEVEIKQVPEFSKKRIAIWRSDSEADKQAVDWLESNPDHPQAYKIYEKLLDKGLIE